MQRTATFEMALSIISSEGRDEDICEQLFRSFQLESLPLTICSISHARPVLYESRSFDTLLPPFAVTVMVSVPYLSLTLQVHAAVTAGKACSPLLTSLPVFQGHHPRQSPRQYLETVTHGLLTSSFFARHPLLVAAGGAVNAACIQQDEHAHDIDLFIVGTRSHEEAAKAIRAAIAEIVEWSAEQSQKWKVMVSVSHNSANVNVVTNSMEEYPEELAVVADTHLSHAMFEIQFIMRLFR